MERYSICTLRCCCWQGSTSWRWLPREPRRLQACLRRRRCSWRCSAAHGTSHSLCRTSADWAGGPAARLAEAPRSCCPDCCAVSVHAVTAIWPPMSLRSVCARVDSCEASAGPCRATGVLRVPPHRSVVEKGPYPWARAWLTLRRATRAGGLVARIMVKCVPGGRMRARDAKLRCLIARRR